MNTYAIRYNQSIFDAALQIYGNVDGVADLMKNNPELSFNSDLVKGQVLNYDPSQAPDPTTTRYFYENEINISNGESNIYKKNDSGYTLAFIMYIPITSSAIKLELAGTGGIAFDWGDNQPIEEFTLQASRFLVVHTMDSFLPESALYRKIKVYTNPTFSLTYFKEVEVANISRVFFVENTTIESFNLGKCRDLDYLGFLKMCDNINTLSITCDNIDSLLPLDEITTLTNLNIIGSVITSVALTEYFIEVVKNYGTRNVCSVDLSGTTTIVGDYQSPIDINDPQNGQEAIWVLENVRGWTFTF